MVKKTNNTKSGVHNKGVTIYKADAHPRIIKNLRDQDKTREEIAEVIGISVKQLMEWRSKYPEVAEALREGMKRSSEFLPVYIPFVRYLRMCGATRDYIVKQLHISASTYQEWQENNPEFAQAASTEKGSADAAALDALQEKIKGHTVIEEKITYEIRENVNYGEPGQPKYLEIPVRKEVFKKQVPPDTNMIKMWLLNRDPQNWSEKGRELKLIMETAEKKELTEDQKKVRTIAEALSNEQKVIFDKLSSKIPPEILLEYIQTGNTKKMAEYVAANNINIEEVTQNDL